jgi:hypothetical protein
MIGRSQRLECILVFAAVLSALPLSRSAQSAEAAKERIDFQSKSGSIEINVGGEPFATFVYQDKDISRPYFAHVKAPGGIQVTRNHPPKAGVDSPDHNTFHPGVWMSFGDINGSDFWRLAAPVKFERFLVEPTGGDGHGEFAVRLKYLDQKDPSQTVCTQNLHIDIHPLKGGHLIVWDSIFASDKPFTFGDQEEMGLGLRVATPIRAERESEIGLLPGNGEIVSSSGARNEKEIWGNSFQWCDYRGELGGKLVGIAIFPHPKNFRPSWFHARDYGMIAANAFGRNAMGKGEKSAVTVKPGEQFRLRYGVFVHAGPEDQQPDVAGAFNAYLKLAGQQAVK